MTTKGTTSTHKDVWEALCAARADFSTIAQSGYNGHFKAHYATMQDIMNATMPALQKHGLVMYQSPAIVGDTFVLVSRIVHAASGECIEDTMPLAKASKPQALGSELTYYRRYMMTAQLCVTDGLDDDGDTARKSDDQPKATPKKAQPQKTANTAQKTVVTPSQEIAEWAKGFEPEEIAMIDSWASPPAAQEWALEAGHFTTIDGAMDAFKFVVNEQFGGELKQSTLRSAMAAFYTHIKNLAAIDTDEEQPF